MTKNTKRIIIGLSIFGGVSILSYLWLQKQLKELGEAFDFSFELRG